MMRALTFIVFCGLIIGTLLGNQAHAADGIKLPGYPCGQLGETRLDDNQKNIIACLCDTTAHPKCSTTNPEFLTWKAMSNIALTCPAGKALTGVSGGEPQCTTIVQTANIACNAGEALTRIVNGAAQCTKQTETPAPGAGGCAAKAITAMNSCPTYYVDRWGHSQYSGTSGSYSAQAIGNGQSVSKTWQCNETTWQYSNYWVTVGYSGVAYCSGGTWNCILFRDFPHCSIQSGCKSTGIAIYYNGAC